MNKLSYTTILAAAFLLLPGCSDDDTIDNGVIESPEVLVGDSEVEIKLSSNSSPLTRRGHLFEEEDPETGAIKFSTLTGRRLGVFCLASNKQMANAPAYVTAPNWNNKGVTGKSDVVLWNEQATVLQGNVDFSTVKYYPATNWYCYDFYAYHQGSSDESTLALSEDGKQITIEKTIDGQDDVIWGKASLTEAEKNALVYTNENGISENYGKYAYSARFFRRQMDASGVITPAALKMEHSLCRFTFTVEVGDEAARGMKISSIALLDMPYNFKMVLANNTYGLTGSDLQSALDEEGSIIPESIDMENTKDLVLAGRYQYWDEETSKYGEKYSDALSYTIPANAGVGTTHTLDGNDATWYGFAGNRQWFPNANILAIPGLNEYTIRIALETAEGTSLICDQPLPFGNAEGLMGSDAVPAKPGYSYNVKIKVYGPQKIGISAELKDWETEEDLDISIELN